MGSLTGHICHCQSPADVGTTIVGDIPLVFQSALSMYLLFSSSMRGKDFFVDERTGRTDFAIGAASVFLQSVAT